MTIYTDFSVATNGDIRHVGASTDTYPVLELHRFLEDLADDAGPTGDDLVDITSDTPSERSTDNIVSLLGTFNLDDDAAQYFYDGSVSQDGGNTLYSGLVVVGATNLTTTLQVVQNNALYDGDSPFWGTGLNADPASAILMRCMIKTRSGGVDIDGKRIRVTAREFGDTYGEFEVTMGLGNSVAAIFTGADLNNTTAAGVVATWAGITNVEGYQTLDLDNGAGARPYFSQWNRDIYTINQLYERAKWLTRRGTASTVYGMDGELFRGITHQWAYAAETGVPAWTQNEVLSWGAGATAGTGALLAVLDSGLTGTHWIQLLTGVAPTNGMTVTGVSSAKTATVNGAPTTRSVSSCFLGVSTGSALIGAYGVGVESDDLTKDDKLTDLSNVLQQPPNIVIFSVTSLVAGEDRVLVGPEDGGDFEFDQLTLNTTLNGAAETAVVVTVAIPDDTPAVGVLRIELDGGTYRRVPYLSWTASTFTIAATDFAADPATAPANVWIAYIDELAAGTSVSFTTKYISDRALVVRVRDGGGSPIKTFQTPATLGSSGGSVAAIRTSDA